MHSNYKSLSSAFPSQGSNKNAGRESKEYEEAFSLEIREIHSKINQEGEILLQSDNPIEILKALMAISTLYRSFKELTSEPQEISKNILEFIIMQAVNSQVNSIFHCSLEFLAIYSHESNVYQLYEAGFIHHILNMFNTFHNEDDISYAIIIVNNLLVENNEIIISQMKDISFQFLFMVSEFINEKISTCSKWLNLANTLTYFDHSVIQADSLLQYFLNIITKFHNDTSLNILICKVITNCAAHHTINRDLFYSLNYPEILIGFFNEDNNNLIAKASNTIGNLMSIGFNFPNFKYQLVYDSFMTFRNDKNMLKELFFAASIILKIDQSFIQDFYTVTDFELFERKIMKKVSYDSKVQYLHFICNIIQNTSSEFLDTLVKTDLLINIFDCFNLEISEIKNSMVLCLINVIRISQTTKYLPAILEYCSTSEFIENLESSAQSENEELSLSSQTLYALLFGK